MLFLPLILECDGLWSVEGGMSTGPFLMRYGLACLLGILLSRLSCLGFRSRSVAVPGSRSRWLLQARQATLLCTFSTSFFVLFFVFFSLGGGLFQTAEAILLWGGAWLCGFSDLGGAVLEFPQRRPTVLFSFAAAIFRCFS